MKRYALVFVLLFSVAAHAAPRWSKEQANTWYSQQQWLVGSNFIPSTAINQLEMWQAETFDPRTIDRELGYAEQLGMNTMRVYLHNIPWEQDAAGFRKRISEYLEIAGKHRIRTIFAWDTPMPGVDEPPVWFHDIFRPDGTPFSRKEVELIKTLTGKR